VGAGRLMVTTLSGKASGVTMKVWVWVPPQYDDPRYAKTAFPVLMLFPGGDGVGYTQWFSFAFQDLLPTLAALLDAKPPLRVPAWLARPLAGSVGIAVMTQQRGAANEKAKRELGWQPHYSTWRDGLAAELSQKAP